MSLPDLPPNACWDRLQPFLNGISGLQNEQMNGAKINEPQMMMKISDSSKLWDPVGDCGEFSYFGFHRKKRKK